MYLRHEVFDPLPDLLHDLGVVPYDASAGSVVGCEDLHPAADVDHGLFPFPVCTSFGGADELVAFGFGEGVVDYDGVVFCVFWDGCFGEVDEGFGWSRGLAGEKGRGEGEGGGHCGGCCDESGGYLGTGKPR